MSNQFYTGAVVKPESLMNLTLHAENDYKYKSHQNVRQVEETSKGKQTKYYNPRNTHGKPKSYEGSKYFPTNKEGGKHEQQKDHFKQGHGEHHEEHKGQGKYQGPRFGQYNPKKMNKKKGTYFGYEDY